MSPAQTRAWLVLGAMALVFIALLVWGGLQPDCDRECQKRYEPGTSMQSLRRLLGPLETRVKLKQPRYDLAHGARQAVPLPEWEGDPRPLKLRLVRGVVELTAEIRPRGEGDPLKPGEQAGTKRLPSDDRNPDRQRRMTYVVMGAGGELRIACMAGPCTLEVE